MQNRRDFARIGVEVKSYMRFLTKVTLCVALLAPQAAFGAQKETHSTDSKPAIPPADSKVPVLPEGDVTKVKLLAAQLQIVQYKFLQTKAEFDKIQAEATADFQKTSAALAAAVEAAYKTAGADKKDWKFDPLTGEFSPASKAETKKP